MSLKKAMVSSKSNEWETPKKLFNQLNKEFNFTLDPCSTTENKKCQKNYTIKENGLKQSWRNEIVFMNPPYGGNTGKWIKKALIESRNGTIVVCLIVSSTDRSYWHDFIFPFAKEIRSVRGRISFGDSKSTAPFASAIIIFDKSKKESIKLTYYSDSYSKGELNNLKQKRFVLEEKK